MNDANANPASHLAPLLLVAATLLWSGNFIVGRGLGDAVHPLGLNAWRWLLATVIVLPLAWPGLRREWRAVLDHWPYLAALGITGVAAFHVFVYQALQHAPASHALLLLSTAPALILLLSAVTLGEAIGRRQRLGVALSLAGAGVLVCRGEPAMLARLTLGAGEAWMLAAVPTWAIYSVLLKRRPASLSQGTVLAASMITGLLAMTPFLALAPSTLVVAWSPSVIAAVVYIGIGASVAAFWCWNLGVARIGPARAGVYLHLMPLFGAALGIALLGESLHAWHALGAAGVFGGIVLAQGSGLPRTLPGNLSRLRRLRTRRT